MNNEMICALCRFCNEYYETHYFCELFESVVSGHGYCHCFDMYPQIQVS